MCVCVVCCVLCVVCVCVGVCVCVRVRVDACASLCRVWLSLLPPSHSLSLSLNLIHGPFWKSAWTASCLESINRTFTLVTSCGLKVVTIKDDSKLELPRTHGKHHCMKQQPFSPIAAKHIKKHCERWSVLSIGCGSKPIVPFAEGAPPILGYSSGDWDVH